MITLENLTKEYNCSNQSEKFGIFNINLKFPDKGLFGIIGQSGCGKTTLLNVIGGFDSFNNGLITYNEIKIEPNNLHNFHIYKEIGFVFQDFKLFENMTVKENLKIVAPNKCSKTEIIEVLKKLKIEKYINKKVSYLSGGEKQRVAIARALIKKPTILLCDEPTGNLDQENSELIIQILSEISNDILVIIATHSEIIINNYLRNIVQLKDGIIKKTVFNNLNINPVFNKNDSSKKSTITKKYFLISKSLNSLNVLNKVFEFISFYIIFLISLFSLKLGTITFKNTINSLLSFENSLINPITYGISENISEDNGYMFYKIKNDINLMCYITYDHIDYRGYDILLNVSDDLPNKINIINGTIPEENEVLISDFYFDILQEKEISTVQINNKEYSISGTFLTNYTDYKSNDFNMPNNQAKEYIFKCKNLFGNVYVKDINKVFEIPLESTYYNEINNSAIKVLIKNHLEISSSNISKKIQNNNDIVINSTLAEYLEVNNVNVNNFFNNEFSYNTIYNINYDIQNIKNVDIYNDNKSEYVVYINNSIFNTVKNNLTDYFYSNIIAVNYEKNTVNKLLNNGFIINGINTDGTYGTIGFFNSYNSLIVLISTLLISISMLMILKKTKNLINKSHEKIGILQANSIRNSSIFIVVLLNNILSIIIPLSLAFLSLTLFLNYGESIYNYASIGLPIFSTPYIPYILILIGFILINFIIFYSYFKKVKKMNITSLLKKSL